MRFLKWISILALSISLPALAITYPQTPRGEQVDVYHGDKIADPYRWMEQTASKKVEYWLDEQKALTLNYLDSTPVFNAIRQRGKLVRKFERYSLLGFENGKVLFSIENPGTETLETSTSTHCLLDTNTPDKAVAFLQDDHLRPSEHRYSSVFLSMDAEKAVYAFSKSGYDETEYMTKGIFTKWKASVQQKIKNLSTLTEYKEVFSNIHPIGWSHDSSGFYYTKYRDKDSVSGHKVFFHALGTSPEKDRVVFEDPLLNSYQDECYVGLDGYLFYTTYGDRLKFRSAMFCAKLDGSGKKAQIFPWSSVPFFGGKKSFLGRHNERMYFVSDTKSGRSKIVALKCDPAELINPLAKRVFTDVVPESSDVLQIAVIAGDHIVACYLHDAHSIVVVFDLNGKKIREIELPGIGTVAALRSDGRGSDLVYQYESFTQAPSIYKYNIDKNTSQPILVPETKFYTADVVTNIVYVEASDGAKIPMFLLHKSGIELNSNTPALLEGYGGFGVNMVPSFEMEALIWMEMGGVYARAGIRGGGEYGEDWHQAAVGVKKATSIRDFISCAEWLCKNKITSPSKLGIFGCSNGGLLTGAAMTKRPDLFGGVCVDSGVLDLLRYLKMNPNLWVKEYGDAINNRDYRSLRALSPLHQIKMGTAYPATLITVKNYDHIVSPANSYKFTAALQHAQKGNNPILIDSIRNKDHGLKAEKDYADKYVGLERLIFLSRALNFDKDAKNRLDRLNDSFSH